MSKRPHSRRVFFHQGCKFCVALSKAHVFAWIAKLAVRATLHYCAGRDTVDWSTPRFLTGVSLAIQMMSRHIIYFKDINRICDEVETPTVWIARHGYFAERCSCDGPLHSARRCRKLAAKQRRVKDARRVIRKARGSLHFAMRLSFLKDCGIFTTCSDAFTSAIFECYSAPLFRISCCHEMCCVIINEVRCMK